MQEWGNTVASATDRNPTKYTAQWVEYTKSIRLSAARGQGKRRKTPHLKEMPAGIPSGNIELSEVAKNVAKKSGFFVQTNEFAIWQGKVAKKS